MKNLHCLRSVVLSNSPPYRITVFLADNFKNSSGKEGKDLCNQKQKGSFYEDEIPLKQVIQKF